MSISGYSAQKGLSNWWMGGVKTRLVTGDRDYGEIIRDGPQINYFNMFIDSLIAGQEIPLTLEEELHPTRIAIRAKKSMYHFLHQENNVIGR